jgi:preprotein translocase SecE subunit
MARQSRKPRPPAGRRSVTAPLAGRPKSQSGGESVAPRGRAGFISFLGEVRGELGKVDFPNRHQTMQSTMVVVALCLIIGIYLYGLDSVFSQLVNLLIDQQSS